MRKVPWVLASDIDNTLTGDADALKRLAKQIDALREQQKLVLFLTTGRTLNEVVTGFQKEGIPQADAIISQVGTEIYLPPFSPQTKPLARWNQFLRQHFSREEADAFLSDIEGAEVQPERYNTPLKVSYFLDKTPNPEQAAELVKRRVAEAENGYQVIWSSGTHLDILPADAGKGKAIRFLIDYLSLAPQQVITAGDSGNDLTMMEEFGTGIIVGNAQPELKALTHTSRQATYYLAKESYAAGVEEGLHHFGVL
jgi:sucrose-6F-phosphate phosphohydrolase